MQNQKKHDIKWFFAWRKPWHQRWWVWIFGLVIILSVPFIINECYKTGTGYQTLWDAKDVLSFYGSFLAFAGTTFLGFVAYKQNERHKASQVNYEAANTLTPFFVIESVVPIASKQHYTEKGNSTFVEFEKSHYTLNGSKAVVNIKNIGQGIATNVSYQQGFGRISNPMDNKVNQAINVGESFQYHISLTEKAIDKVITKEIEYQNIVGYQFKQVLFYKLVCEPRQVSEDELEDELHLYVYLLSNQQRIGIKEATTNDNT